MQECLTGIKGLEVHDTEIVATAQLGATALDSIAKAMDFLLDLCNFTAAGTLIRMCRPMALLKLFQEFPGLMACDATEVREAIDETLGIGAGGALARKDYSRFFTLLSSCSPKARPRFLSELSPLTKNMFKDLDNPLFIDAVRMMRKHIVALGANARETGLRSLLSIAGDLDPAKALAMKCLVWPALTTLDQSHGDLFKLARLPVMTRRLLEDLPGSLRSRVLRVAVDQVVAERSVENVNRLRELASLSNEIDTHLAIRLRSRITRALIGLPGQWDEAASEICAQIEVAFSVELRFQIALDKLSPADQKIQQMSNEALKANAKARDFRNAMRAGNLHEAAEMIRDSQDLAFRAAASARLLEVAVDKLAEVGIQVRERQRTEPEDDEAAKKQTSVAHDIALMLVVTGEPRHKELAATVSSLVGAPKFISMLLEKLEAPGHDLRGRVATALPALCHSDLSFELDFLLGTDQGQQWLAQAVIDYLLGANLSDATTVVPVFKALAHRVDLQAALRDSRRLEQRMASIRFDPEQLRECATHLHQWLPGWRLLLIMTPDSSLFQDRDPDLRLAVMAIDAVAANAEPGGPIEGIDGLASARLDGWLIQKALSAMLQRRVTDKPLLSDDALSNVMRAVVRDKVLAQSTLEWIEKCPQEQGVRLYTALVSLPRESPPAAFNEKEWEQLWNLASTKT
ncbi:hypothetical protein C7T35_17260 [Variovorax sp. WS11]|nr:hypothetical protein C7T35_17260 [Variovorax sp. WS11]